MNKFLELLAVHLEQGLADGDPHWDLVCVSNPINSKGHHMLAPEDVAAVATAGHGGDFAPKTGSRVALVGPLVYACRSHKQVTCVNFLGFHLPLTVSC